MHTREEQMQAFGRLLDIMDELREKCPWDSVQTNDSLRQNTIEEVYELCDAIMKDNKADICKELGDVLLHVVFYAKIGSETGDYDIKDVCDKLCDKLIYRHPHIYGTTNVNGEEQVLQNWEQLKLKEKGELKLDDQGNIKGIDDMLAGLKTQYPTQFESSAQKKIEERKLPDGDNSQKISQEDFNKMGYQDRLKVFNDNPELYNELSGNKE